MEHETRETAGESSASQVVAYVALTYALTWAFTIPFVYSWHKILHGEFRWWVLVFLPAPFGPTAAALVLTYRLEGEAAAKALAKKLIEWRAPLRWYAFAALTPLAITLIALTVSGFRDDALAGFDPGAWYVNIPLILLLALPFGPLPEELGWRGYALPRLLQRHNVWVASLLVGVMWTFWHTPMFWFPGAAIPSFLELSAYAVALYTIQIIGESLVMTFLYIKSRGNIVLAIVYHLAFNTQESIVFSMTPDPPDTTLYTMYLTNIALTWLLGIACLASLPRNSSS